MRLRHVAAGIPLASALAWLFTVACQLVLPTVAKDDDPASDASVDAVGDTCMHASVPRPPNGGEPGTINAITAVQTIGFADGGAALGYDLDGVCTDENGPVSCVPPARGTRVHRDEPGGRDIAGNVVLAEALQGALAATNLGDVNARIASGHLGYLIEIKRYNGARDQRALSVAFYDSNGLYAVADGGIVNIPPRWDGMDSWTLDCRLTPASCAGSSTELTWLQDASFTSGSLDPQAYVADNVLVAKFASLVFNVGLTSLTVSNVILTATISPVVTGGYRLDGQIAGRLTTRDAFIAVARLKDPNGASLCGSTEAFQNTVRPSICKAADISGQESTDNKGAPCDAMSVAVPFRALPARVGYRFDSDPFPEGCPGNIAGCNND